ncbi:MAG: hypothetical protein K0S35_2378, partial [Geminicoccaceae bacterium]|nr:hypothetical protein [Geminicoccaceae bacterium]
MAGLASPAAALAWLRTPQAIRARAGLVLAAALRDELRHFALDPGRLDPAADYVVDTIRGNYPDLRIPYHSRWRHFAAGGRDRWAALAAELHHVRPDDLARMRFDLVVVSVLLDAGAGNAWRYAEPGTGAVLARSEGLAVASLDLFRAGTLSARPDRPLRADAAALIGLDEHTLGQAFQVTDDNTLGQAFQVTDDNPLVGLAGRCELLSRLGRALTTKPELFGASAPRIGGLFDHLAGQAGDRRLPASAILTAVLEGFGDIWPGRIALQGVNLGDVGRHPTAATDDLTSELVPFHKLSQWLAYSLIEPLEDAGITVTDLDQLTALAEYRNGG